MLQSGRNLQGQPLTTAERQMLQQQLKSLQQTMRALQLSEQAREFLRKLMSDPNFQEAMKLLSELQKQLENLRENQIPQISPEELERMLKELEKAIEELAKQYGDDEKIRELARQILEAVKRLKEGGT
jgi:translation initiation factor 2B subunit (eIF-2B alpha/beta/delta family)